MAFLGTLPLYGEAFLRLLFPSLCAACDNLLELKERGLCSPCKAGLDHCRFQAHEEKIRTSLPHTDEGWSLFRYEERVKDLFHQIKFKRRRDLLHLFNEPLHHFLAGHSELERLDGVIPVPLDAGRRLEREFNQSGLLADKISKITGVTVRRNVLLKRRSTPAQSLLGREGREINLKGAFRVSNPHRIRGRWVLLVDDIFTTGATVEEAARTLREAGAARVSYLALARALGR